MKTIAKILIVAALWAVCGYIDYGFELGYFTHKYPATDHVSFALGMSIAGPLAFPAVLFDTPHHWRTTPLTPEQRWEAFHRECPTLDREYFEQHYN